MKWENGCLADIEQGNLREPIGIDQQETMRKTCSMVVLVVMAQSLCGVWAPPDKQDWLRRRIRSVGLPEGMTKHGTYCQIMSIYKMAICAIVCAVTESYVSRVGRGRAQLAAKHLGIIASAFFASQSPASAASPFGEWVCFPTIEEMFDASFADDAHRVNNIALSRDVDIMSGAKRVLLSASASNRASGATAFSVEAVAFADDPERPIFSISARPSFGIVQPSRTEEVEGWVLDPKGAFAGLKKACIRATTFSKS